MPQEPASNNKPPLPPSPWNTAWRSLLLYFGIAIVVGSVVFTFLIPRQPAETVSLSTLITDIKEERVEKVTVKGEEIIAVYRDGTEIESRKEGDSSLLSLLYESGVENVQELVEIDIQDPAPYDTWLGVIINILPILLIGVFILMFFRQAQRSSGSIFGFGKSNAKLFRKDMPQVTFADAAGVEEAKQELTEVVDFLKYPDKYLRMGARIPRGVLLIGPAGVGKTLLARAVAGEAGVPFYSIAGSEFMEMFVGVGASRVRDLFETAKRSAPSIIFIDEIESIGRQRGTGASSSHGEQEQTLNQILVEMDGFTPNTNVIILAATNRPDLLDPALTRPGRFDRRVALELPDIDGRKEILEIHMKGKPINDDVSVEKLAKRTVGFSGADLENMLNEAAILAAREGRDKITKTDLEEAATKVKMGPSRRRMQSDEDKKMTAYHEAGHAIVSHFLPHMDPVHRVSIVARGAALGFTMIPPQEDRYHQTETRLNENICALLGGRAAEELFFEEMSVGASNDIERASKIARDMVTRFGMSSLGPRALPASDREDDVWGMERPVNYSDQLLTEIDKEVGEILDAQYQRAVEILKEHKHDLDRIAKELIEKETLEADDFEELLKKPE